MKFGVVNKSTILNRFVLHTLQRNITHLAVITRKTNIKLVILKGGGRSWKRAGGSENLVVCTLQVGYIIHTLRQNYYWRNTFFLSFFLFFLSCFLSCNNYCWLEKGLVSSLPPPPPSRKITNLAVQKLFSRHFACRKRCKNLFTCSR